MQRINPFEAPDSSDDTATASLPRKPITLRQQMVLWTFAVLANIPFCFYMGMAVHGGNGTVGQCLGVLLLIWLGYLLALKMPWVQRAIRYGSVVTALSQAMRCFNSWRGCWRVVLPESAKSKRKRPRSIPIFSSSG